MITGASKRVGRAMAIACARAGADVLVHYHTSSQAAEETRRQIESLGRRAWTLPADFSTAHDVTALAEKAFRIAPVYGLVNNAAIFGGGRLQETTLQDWNSHLAVNLTAPYILTQAFGQLLGVRNEGRVVNLLDWRAVRPGADHFSYTVSKAALAAMTRSLALSMAPNVSVNGLALGAFLPPEGMARDPEIARRVPLGRWGTLEEACHALIFLLAGPAYVTGEIIHVDGGRHLL